MEIKIDAEAMQGDISGAIGEAITNAIGSYDVSKALSETITNEVAVGAVFEAITKALESLDSATLVTHLATELHKAVTAATILVLRDNVSELVSNIRGISSYETEKRDRVKAEINAIMKANS